jgi:hypothetical protein
MNKLLTEKALDPDIWRLFAYGLGGAFVIALGVFLVLLFHAEIDHGFLGLIFLLIMVIFLVAFSFLVAAATPSLSMKVAVTVFNGVLAFGSKLLSDRFLKYLES